MHRIIAGGTGFIGQYLVHQWLAAGKKVTVIGRSLSAIHKVFGDDVQGIIWNELPEQSRELFRGAELVLNLAGANIGSQRWTSTRKQQLIDSRVNTTMQLCELLALMGDKAPPLFNASAIGIYDLAKPSVNFAPPVDETSIIDPTQTHGFLRTIAEQWEMATHASKAHGVHILHLRFAVVLGKGGGVLAKLLPTFRLGLGGKIGSGQQAFSWIHIDDVAAIIELLLAHPEFHGAVNLVAPECVSQAQFAKTLGQVLHRPTCMNMPAWLLHLMFGEMADELLLAGQHVKPYQLEKLHYRFLYPTLREALQQCI